MNPTHDIAIIGAGAVGSAIARELSRYKLNIALLESNPDVGMGTSKASTAIWHTGYDATPGSLESKLLKRSYALTENFMRETGSPFERIGGLMIAWNDEQLRELPTVLDKAIQNGDSDVRIVDSNEIYRLEPALGAGALGGMFIPGEGILCTFTIPLACATQAVVNGVTLKLNFRVEKIIADGDAYILSSGEEKISAHWVVNAAGLFSDEVNAYFGATRFTVRPRRGQLIIYDKLARPLVKHVLLPVPTSITKGVLISPTIYGNIMLGPTAEDLDDKSATQTTERGLDFLREKGRQILPRLLDEEVTATYSGLRAATEFSDYQIFLEKEKRYVCVGGIRSTGISGALGIAEYVRELLGEGGVTLTPKDDFKTMRVPNIGEAFTRPYQNAQMIAADSSYAEIICHCERVSRGEIRDALTSPIPATTLDGLRRRTRAGQGRCQGFNCHAALVKVFENENMESDSLLSDDVGASFHTPYQTREQAPAFHKKNADVLIVGAGPAGLSAAIELKKLGIKNVLVVEREAEAGGMPRFCHHTGFGREDLWRMMQGPSYAKYYRERAEKAGVEILASTTITGWSDSKLRKSFSDSSNKNSSMETPEVLNFTSPRGLGEIHARAVLLATGVRERPRSARLVPGTRPQGIYTTGSLQRFVYQEKLPVGNRALIVGAELVSLSALLTLMHAKVECAMMVTEESRHQIEFPYVAMKWLLADLMTRAPILTNSRITNIFGSKRVEAVEITTTRLRKSAQTSEVSSQIIACDTLIFTGDWIPEHELARLGGLEIRPLTKGPLVGADFHSSVRGVFAAGNLLRGVETADHCAIEGARAARNIVRFLRG